MTDPEEAAIDRQQAELREKLMAKILAGSETLQTAEFAARIGVEKEKLWDMMKRNRVLCLRYHSVDHFPIVQIDQDGKVYPWLQATLAKAAERGGLGADTHWGIMSWLTEKRFVVTERGLPEIGEFSTLDELANELSKIPPGGYWTTPAELLRNSSEDYFKTEADLFNPYY